jgi:hypothetical protein
MAHKGGKNGKGKTRKAARAASAQQLAAERAQRSPAQQLAVLDQRLGAGQGAKRERARLASQLKKSKS